MPEYDYFIDNYWVGNYWIDNYWIKSSELPSLFRLKRVSVSLQPDTVETTLVPAELSVRILSL